jgi:hypothetical protein
MDRLSTAKEYAYGASHLAFINAEIEALEAQNLLLDKTMEIA